MRRGAALLVVAVPLVAAIAFAQRMDPRRPETVIVGLPGGPSPLARVDAKRSGQTTNPLPAAPLRVAWRKPVDAETTGQGIVHAPLALTDNSVLVITNSGKAVWFDAEGNRQADRALGMGATGAPVILADGTVVVVASNDEVIGFKSDAIKFRTVVGGVRGNLGGRIAPLPLPDGGVVVCTSQEFAVLDGGGGIRARATAPEAISGPLLASRGKVIAIAASGVVYSWAPGRDMVRVGSFGGVVDGGAAIMGDHTLVAMVDPGVQSRIVVLDLDTGVAAPRATAPANQAYLGPPAINGDVVYGLGGAAGRNYVIAVDAAGQEKLRVAIPLPSWMSAVTSPSDGGILIYTPPPHTGVIVDRAGAIAFATPDGTIGMVDSSGGFATTGADSPCHQTRSFAVAGIAPLGPGAFVVACTGGMLAKITSTN